jgi:magnesium chelatase accessory protein
MSDKPNWSVDGKDWPNRAASRFVDAAGLRWHVQMMGEGPVALLAHGTGAATHSWRDLAPLLARHFTVVAPDLSGHGFTATPHWQRLSLDGMSRDLAILCERLAVQPQIAIGHSAGAAILTRMTIDGLIAPRLIVSLNGAYLPFGGVAAQFFSPLAKMMALNPLVPRLFAWRGRDPAAVHRLLKGTGSTLDAHGERFYRRLVGSPGHVGAALEMMANWDCIRCCATCRGSRRRCCSWLHRMTGPSRPTWPSASSNWCRRPSSNSLMGLAIWPMRSSRRGSRR